MSQSFRAQSPSRLSALVQNTHSLPNSGVSHPPSQQPVTKKRHCLGRKERGRQGGREQCPTPLPPYHTGSLPGCKASWCDSAQRTAKHGLKQETSASTPKKPPRAGKAERQ